MAICNRNFSNSKASLMSANVVEMYQARVNATNGNIVISSFELLPLWPL